MTFVSDGSHSDAGPLEAISMGWSDQELKRDPRVRDVREGRVQCSACGKWTQQQNWEAHYLFRCRNQVSNCVGTAERERAN